MRKLADLFRMAGVKTFFSRIKAQTVILAPDTCYSGAGGGPHPLP